MAPRKRDPSRQATIERDAAWQPSIELRERVHVLAGRWSRDRPGVQEDLEQEALLSIWMKGETEAPLSHQLRTAQNRMLSFRKLGRSVDGKLDATYQRAKTYVVLSMEREGVMAGDDLIPFQDLLPSSSRVEAYTVAKLTFLELLAVLEPEERSCVILLCEGFTLREVAAITQHPLASIRCCLADARDKLWPLLCARREG